MAALQVGNVWDWRVFIEHETRGKVRVARLFDNSGSETFDLTEAFEAEVEGKLVSLDGAQLHVEATY